jgi:hypothetical protein
MQSEDRIIHFSCELIHAPAPVKKDALQKLYFELSQTRGAAYDSTDFSNPVQGRLYSRRGKTQSLAVFLPDRVLLVEEWADITLTDFLDKVKEVASRAMEARGVSQYVAHTATIRATFALTHHEDSRPFLMETVCQQGGKIDPFLKRPLAVGGMKFVLPETNDHRGNLNVAIESFRHSKNEVFVEVKGVFGRERIDAANLDRVVENIRFVRSFITDNVQPYLAQYDLAQSTPE